MFQPGGGGRQQTLKLNPFVNVQVAAYNPLPYVITNISILAIFQVMLFFIHLFVMSRTDFRHANGGLVLHSAPQKVLFLPHGTFKVSLHAVAISFLIVFVV
jgi:hypothetical protein